MFNTLCNTAQCVNLQCSIGPLIKDEEVSIAVRYRINIKSLIKITQSDKIRVSTKLFAIVTSQPFVDEPVENIARSYEIMTTVLPFTNMNTADIVPLWIVVISACAGTSILLLLVYLLYKVCSIHLFLYNY
jgi:integrin alpha 8